MVVGRNAESLGVRTLNDGELSRASVPCIAEVVEALRADPVFVICDKVLGEHIGRSFSSINFAQASG